MKTPLLFLSSVIVVCATSAQERGVLRPDGEAIPVRSGHVLDVIKESAGNRIQQTVITPPCPNSEAVGVVPGTPTVNFGYNYGDVATMIYTAPFTGVIESVYFMSYGAVAMPDSTASLRIMGANTTGLPATTWMGYWPDSTTCDSIALGTTAYQDEATGPYVPGEVNYPPVNGTELWGLGGFPIPWRGGQTVTGVRMMDLGYEPTITAGDSFAVCIRVPACPNTGTNRNEMSGVTGSGQGRFFKFYHLPRLGTTDYGWYCRADYDMFMWVVMRAATPLPPVLELSRLPSALDTIPRRAWLRTYRCDAFGDTTLSDSGIAGANLL